MLEPWGHGKGEHSTRGKVFFYFLFFYFPPIKPVSYITEVSSNLFGLLVNISVTELTLWAIRLLKH